MYLFILRYFGLLVCTVEAETPGLAIEKAMNHFKADKRDGWEVFQLV